MPRPMGFFSRTCWTVAVVAIYSLSFTRLWGVLRACDASVATLAGRINDVFGSTSSRAVLNDDFGRRVQYFLANDTTHCKDEYSSVTCLWTRDIVVIHLAKLATFEYVSAGFHREG